uniref:DUF4283 domain-containing protein n=1 Tax=Cannabis sativa TaxID=3483 RepID=A0A803PCF5_CANSA
MDPLLSSIDLNLNLTEEESSVFLLHEDVIPSSPMPNHTLLARVITQNHVHKPTFIDQMSNHWNGRFPVTITEYREEYFKVTFGCERDRFRVMNKEPWHFQNHLVVFCTPDALQNAIANTFNTTSFWVQVYRLPFLSNSKLLANALGDIIGEFVNVHEESLDEGCDPFFRIQVKLLVDKPLLRGKIGHTFEKCAAFMERMDNGNDDDMLYGPWMNGARLPTTDYNKYRTDFSKSNAWPFVTRFACKGIVSSIPKLGSNSHPQPPPLFRGESCTAPTPTPRNNAGNVSTSTQSRPATLLPINTLNTSTSQPNHSHQTTSTGLNVVATGFSSINQHNPNAILPPNSDAFINLYYLHYKHCHYHSFCRPYQAPRVGLSGGLMLLWKNDVDVTLLNYGSSFFDCYLKNEDEPSFHFIGFYGSPNIYNRSSSLTLLKRLADVAPLSPWLAIGEFNEILSNSNKSGGDPFTWIKNRSTLNTIKERLDRGLKVHSKADIAEVVHNYFAVMFMATGIDEAALSTTLQCIPTLVTDEDNDILSRIFTTTEVEAA